MMKVPKSLRDRHAIQTTLYQPLKERVDIFMHNHKQPRWHYESRLKALESFALKIESGRQTDLDQFEDFFACTLVVENLDSMAEAERLVRGRFKFSERRPKTDIFTSKPSDCFRFDDTRLYVSWKDGSLTKPSGLNGLLFEIQIKTFLAHSWVIAAHELIYKTDEINWPKERIAFQIKAMLEHAETSIQEANKLSKSKSLRKTNAITDRISSIIDMLNELWPAGLLPHDKKRLAENVDNLIRHINIDVKTLRQILKKETERGRGASTLNLSPYATIVQSLLNQKKTAMQKYLTGRPSHRFKVYLPREIQIPSSLASTNLNNAIIDTDD